jgi:uncharacterized membrane protein
VKLRSLDRNAGNTISFRSHKNNHNNNNNKMDKVKGAAKGAVNGVKSIKWSDVKRNTMLMAWMLSGIAVVLAPIIQWTVHKNEYYKAVGYAIEYENEQNQQNDDGNDDGSDYAAYYKECGWWNVVCQREQINYADYYMGDNNNGQDEDGNYEYQFTTPTWFVILSGGNSEEMSRWKEENTGVRDEMDETGPTAGAIMAVIYMFLAFLVVLGIGCATFYKSKPLSTIKWSLVFIIQMCLINFLLLPSLISNEDRMWDESIYGWYGQIGVLMAFFDFWVLIFSTIFLVVLYLEDRKNGSEDTTTSTTSGDEYNNMA